ncbi:MAG: aldehyde ferredoxin oxidoreductase family protein [Desulfobacteraceae bacterium]|nr:aldehyde ferredoxin oxidoreductase family protein [Desulfobacteraceae bacterium]
MFGCHNTIVSIDATRQEYRIENISDEIISQTLGGKGLGAQLLLDRNPPKVDPLSPQNHLIFSIGPTAGTAVWGSSRYGVFTKSPQTGYFSESYSGGTVAEYMARTGFDAFVIRGACPGPSWIEISDKGIVFHDAAELMGLDTYETEDRVRAWIRENRPDAKKCGVITIGPAGENRVVFAVIENDYWRSAGRTGVGAVMGSKNIKAVAFWGNTKKQTAEPELVKRFNREIAQISKEDKGVHAYKTKGTPMLVDILNEAGGFPTRYWNLGRASHSENINAEALHDRCEVKPHACLHCLMACGRLSTVKQGRHKGLRIEGPEYETIFAFGGLCEVKEIEEIAYLNDIGDRLGVDTMTVGNLAGFTIEAVLEGKLDFDIDYGEVDKIARLIEDIAYRRGIGDILAGGIRHAAGKWGMEDRAVHVKGLEPAGYDPRVLKGMALSYGTSDRGACHLRATFYKPELAGMVDPEQIEGKAEVFAEWEDRLTVFDCLILCRFYRDLYQWEQLAKIINAVTGMDMDKGRMRALAASVSDNTRRFNIREGLTIDEDRLPKHFHKQALPETNKIITEDQMNRMLKEYYRARGWDKDGKPEGM